MNMLLSFWLRSVPLVILAFLATLVPAQMQALRWGSKWADSAHSREIAHVQPGNEISLALKSNGTIVAWGYSVTTPQLLVVPPLPAGVTYVQVSADGRSALALRSDGVVVGWGDNTSGQISVPPFASSVSKVSAAFGSSAALLANGNIVTWGSFGSMPVPSLPAGSTYIDVMARQGRFLAIRSDGVVVQWGFGAANPFVVPAASYDAILDWYVLRRTDGSIWSQTAAAPPPSAGTTYVGAAAVPVGSMFNGFFAVGLLSSGATVTWGNTLPGNLMPPPVPPGLTYTQIASAPGGSAFAARRSDGVLVTWGDSGSGQRNIPALPPGVGYQKVVAAGDCLGLRTDGVIVAFEGETDPNVLTPPPLPSGMTYIDFDAEFENAVALRSDGQLVAWGESTYGVLNVPAIPAGRYVKQISVGSRWALVLLDDGTVLSWGQASASTNLPVPPAGMYYATVVAAANTVIGLRSDGVVRVAGAGALPANGALDSVPTLPAGMTYTQIDGRSNTQAFSLRSDGRIIAWGQPSSQTSVPALPAGVTYVRFVAGDFHCLALRSDGVLVGWGDNSGGQCNVPALPAGAVPGSLSAASVTSLVTYGAGQLAGFQVFGQGCANHLGMSGLVPLQYPRLGQTLAVQVTNVPQNLAVMIMGVSNTAFAGGALPAYLGALGAPSCFLRVSPDSTALLVGAGGSAVFNLPIPNSALLMGLSLHQQAAIVDSAAGNALGLTFSDAATLLLGL